MPTKNNTFRTGSLLRPIGLLVLILVFVFQLMAPAANAAIFSLGGHAHHKDMSHMASDCPVHFAKSADITRNCFWV